MDAECFQLFLVESKELLTAKGGSVMRACQSDFK